MWLQIVLSIVLAAAALQFVFYAARHELVPVLHNTRDFTVRYPRFTLWVAVVLLALTASLVLSMVIWQSISSGSIFISSLLLAAALYGLLLALVWRIDVNEKHLLCRSALGTKRLIHYEDIEAAVVTKHLVLLQTPIKTFRMSNQVLYVENMLQMLADHNVPITRDQR